MSTTQNLAGSLAVQNFNLSLVTASGSPALTTVVFDYKAIGPASTSNTLTTYEYSTNGITFNTMTLETPSQINNVETSESGTVNQLTWSGFTDIGMNLFGKKIWIRLALSDGTHTTPDSLGSFTIQKVVSTPESRIGDKIQDNTFVGASSNSIIKELFSVR